VTSLSARSAYKGIVAVFYAGTVWMVINAAYYLATGTSQVDTSGLSTGGLRILSGSVGTYMAAALILALLNLQLDTNARRRILHAAIAGLAAFAVTVAFTRAVYLGLLLPIVFLLLQGRVRRALLSVLPICIPFLVLLGILAGNLAPQLGPTFLRRITASPTRDANVLIRERSSAEVRKQFLESPLPGVGFGRTAWVSTQYRDPQSGIVFDRRLLIGQDPHDSYVYLLAGGGLLVVVPFFLMLIGYAIDVVKRLRGAGDRFERALLLWSALSLIVILVSAAAGTVFEQSSDVLAMWTLLVLPAIVPRPQERIAPDF